MRFSFVPLLTMTLAVAVITPTIAQAPPTVPKQTLGAIGIGVSNLQRAAKFYIEVLGLKDSGMRYYTPLFDEIILSHAYPGSGSALVLMQWKTPKNLTNSAIKLVFYVENMKTTFDKIRKAGQEILTEPGTGKMGNVTIPTGFARDPDGYLLEFNPTTLLPKSSTPAKGTGA